MTRNVRVAADGGTQASDDLAQRTGRDSEDPRQPLRAHRLWSMERQGREQPALARAREIDHTVRGDDTHRAQNAHLDVVHSAGA